MPRRRRSPEVYAKRREMVAKFWAKIPHGIWLREATSVSVDSKDNVYVLSIKKENISVELFFDINNYNLVGWQTEDMYQNKVNTSLFDLKKNQNIDKKLFRLPTIN